MDDQEPRKESPSCHINRRKYIFAAGAIGGSLVTGMPGDATALAGAEIPIEQIAATIDHRWKGVELSGSFSSPVVVPGPLSVAGPEPASTRLREITSDSLEISLEEWAYLDGIHFDEKVYAVAIDAGEYTLDSDTVLAAGTVDPNDKWTSIEFPSSLSARPVVFSETQTTRGSQAAVTRQANISESGMNVRLQGAEGEGPPSSERVGYMAIEPGTGTLNGQPFEAGVREGINHRWFEITFENTYQEPLFIASLQTTRGNNPGVLRRRYVTGASAEVRIQEERSRDDETWHKKERIGYLVVEKSVATDGFGGEKFGDEKYGS